MPDHPPRDKTFVVFIDALGPQDVEETTFIKNQMESHGTLDAGVPRVTPAVLSSIYTGADPADTGLPAVQRYNEEERYRPEQFTLPEMAAMGETYEKVLNYHLPFACLPPKVPTGEEFWSVSGAMGNTQVGPQDAAPLLQVAGPAGDLRQGHPDSVFNLNVDFTEAKFTSARQVIEGQDFDCAFIGYRLLDSYTHWQRTMSGDESNSLFRDDLIKKVDQQVYLLSKLGDVFVFGDHGSVPMDELFRINRWLVQNDYLDIDINFEWIQQSEEYGVIEGENHPVEEALPNQINWQHPGVTINEAESVAISGDPFWSSLTLLGGATEARVEELISDLLDTGHFDDVYRKENLWSEDALHFDKCPDIIPDQKEGHYVTGNIHPYPVGAGYMRSGVHGRLGAWASTKPLPSDGEEVSPIGLHEIIRDEFLDLGSYVPYKEEMKSLTEDERQRLINEIGNTGPKRVGGGVPSE